MEQERVSAATEALRRITPHQNRYAVLLETQGRYVQRPDPVENGLFKDHIEGKSTLGAVAADDSGCTNCVGVDIDAHQTDQQPLDVAQKFMATANAWEIPAVCHTSKSGKGFHIRTLFTEPVPAYLARALYICLAAASGTLTNQAFDKVWPCQTGFGVLALPLQAKWAYKNRGGLAVDTGNWEILPKAEQIPHLLEADAISRAEVEDVLRCIGVQTEEKAKAISGAGKSKDQIPVVQAGVDGGVQLLMVNCLAAIRFITAVEIKYEFWISMLSNLKPFHGGLEIADFVRRKLAPLDPGSVKYQQNRFESQWRTIKSPHLCSNLDSMWLCPNVGKCRCRAPAGMPFWLARAGLVN